MELILIIIPIVSVFIYRSIYFKSTNFALIKDSVSALTSEFNELNEYADFLSLNILGGQTEQIFVGSTHNNSSWGYKHSGLFSRQNHSQIYHCSRSIVGNAQLDGFKYLCKYFNINVDEESRNIANEMLNNFTTYFESRDVLVRKRDLLFVSIRDDLPFLISAFKKSLFQKLG